MTDVNIIYISNDATSINQKLDLILNMNNQIKNLKNYILKICLPSFNTEKTFHLILYTMKILMTDNFFFVVDFFFEVLYCVF